MQLAGSQGRARSGSFDGTMRSEWQQEVAGRDRAGSNDFDCYDDDAEDDDDEGDEDDYEEEDKSHTVLGTRRARSNSVPNIHLGSSGNQSLT